MSADKVFISSKQVVSVHNWCTQFRPTLAVETTNGTYINNMYPTTDECNAAYEDLIKSATNK